MANWSSLSVKNAIVKIKDKEIVLPVIQRRLVWAEEKMELLFDSLLKGNSFGSVICIEEEKDRKPLFAFREFSRDGNNVASMEIEFLPKTQLFVIDGQQRLQSFYIGLVGSYNGKRMYFDLYSDYIEDEYDFKFAVKAENLPKTNKERIDSTIGDCLWYPVDDLFVRLSDTNEEDQVAEEITKKYSVESEGKIKHIVRNIRVFHRGVFTTDSIGISKVSVNKSKNPVENRQRIVELFRRLNDGGTKLSSYDLAASMFKGFDYKMEQFLDTVVTESSDVGINQDVLIKLLLILHDKPSNEISNLTDEDAEFAVSHCERIQAALKALKSFLIASSNYNWFSAAKNRSAIPLYFLTYHIFYSQTKTDDLGKMFEKFDTTDKNFHSMAVWLRLSLLNKVFSRGCGWIPYKTGIRKLHAVMQRNRGADFPQKEMCDVYRHHPLDFSDSITESKVSLFDHEYLFYLIYNGQPSIRSEDIDHIHPQSLLWDKGIDGAKINGIGNLQLLDSGTNRGAKSNKELSEWIENGIDPLNRQEYLKRHVIPIDAQLWKTENFENFFQERLRLIAEKINNFL